MENNGVELMKFCNIKKIMSTSIFKKVSGLTIGNFIAQIISMLMVFFLSKFYLETEIGIYYVFQSYVAIISTISTFSYHLILPTIKDHEIIHLFWTIIFLANILGMGTIIFFNIFYYQYGWLLYGISISSAIIQFINTYNLRMQKITLFGINVIITSLINFFSVIILWELNLMNAEYLINIFTIANIIQSGSYFYFSKIKIGTININYIKSILIGNLDKPIFITSGNLINTVAYNLPIIIIEKYFGSMWAAQYGLVLKISNAPITLIGNAFSQVGFSEISKLFRKNYFEVYPKIRTILIYNSIICLFLGSSLFCIVPMLINVFLGARWDIAGNIIQIFAPMYGFMLLITPIDSVYYIYKKEKLSFLIQFSYLLISIIAFTVGVYINNIWTAFYMFSVLSSVRYYYIAKKLLSVVKNYDE